MGLRVEDFEIGRKLVTRGRTVGEGDIMNFAGLVGDYTPVHVDEVYARTTQFGTRIAHGPLSMSMALGLFIQLGLLDDSVIGLLNLNWNFKLPVKIGDTLHAEVVVQDTRMTSKPGSGVVKFGFEVINQDGKAVQDGVLTVLVKTRDAP